MHMCMCPCVGVCTCANVPLEGLRLFVELEFQAVVSHLTWVMGTDLFLWS